MFLSGSAPTCTVQYIRVEVILLRASRALPHTHSHRLHTVTSLAACSQCSTERRNYVEIFYADRFSGRYCLSFSSLLFSSSPPLPNCSHRTTWHFVSLQSFTVYTTHCTVLFCTFTQYLLRYTLYSTVQCTVFRAVFVSLRLRLPPQHSAPSFLV